MKNFPIFTLCVFLMATGCVLSKPEARNSRFFGDYSQFKKLNKNTWIYLHPTLRVVDYEKLLFEPVSVYENPAKKSKNLDQVDLEEFGKDLRHKVIDAFEKDNRVVPVPGPGVVIIKMAIIDIKPFTIIKDENGNQVFRADTTLEGTKFEVDCIDSDSGERVAALISLLKGKKYSAHKDIAQLGNVEEAFYEWVGLLKQMLTTAKTIKEKNKK